MSIKPPTGANDPLDDAQGFLDVVEDFGAAPNDSTVDSTAAINAADVAARAAGSGVFFKAGTYYVSTVNYSTGSHWVGVGKRASVLKMKDNTANGSVAKALVSMTANGATDFSFRSLGFYGNRANGNHGSGGNESIFGLNAVDGSRFSVSDCEFRNFRGDGVYLGYSSAGCSAFSVHDCDFIDCGIKESGDTGSPRQGVAVISGSDFSISDNYFDTIGSVCIDLEANSGSNTFSNVVLDGNYFGTNIGTGVTSFFVNLAPTTAANATGIAITNNVGRGAPKLGFFLLGQGITVAGNTLLAVLDIGIKTGVGSLGVTITGNTVKTTSSSATNRACVYLDGNGSTGTTYSTVIANTLLGTVGNYGVEERPGSGNNTLGPNVIENTSRVLRSVTSSRLAGPLEHVAGATPTGGLSGDIKVGTSKIWVNDAGTWRSVAVA